MKRSGWLRVLLASPVVAAVVAYGAYRFSAANVSVQASTQSSAVTGTTNASENSGIITQGQTGGSNTVIEEAPRAGDVNLHGDVRAGSNGGGSANIGAGTGYNGASGGNVTVGPGHYSAGDGGRNGNGGDLTIKAGDSIR